MRIAVVGTSGSGKTTLGRELSAALQIPFVELDAINWQSGWRDLFTYDLEEFKRRVDTALSGEAWIADGNYGSAVGPSILGRATHLIWLDYERPVIMRRVIWRSLLRAIDRTELWPGTGNRESFAKWLDEGHPIRWAWDTHRARRKRFEDLTAEPENAHLKVLRLRRPSEARNLSARLR